MQDQIVIKSPDGTFRAHISRPAKLPAPTVVVLQELFGVNADTRATCDELAFQGFIAIAPDLFWRQEPGVDLDVRSEADWQHGLRLYAAYDRDAGAKNIRETVRTAVELPESTRKVAVQGYCLGALMAFNRGRALRGRRCRCVSRRRHGKISRRGWRAGSPVADAPRRRGRIHLKDGANRDQSGARKQAERGRLQLSRSAPRLLSAQRRALRCHGGSAGERTDK
jgi:hypothetical protein